MEHKARNENAELLAIALDAVKFHILSEPDRLNNVKWRDKVFEKVIELL